MSNLILPGTNRQSASAASYEFGVFVTPEKLFPDLEVTEATLIRLLGTMGRDAVLFACAHLNAVVSGIGHPNQKPRQERAIRMMCTAENLKRINAIPQAYPGSGLSTVFFRGQLLELMRWAVRFCPVIPDDGGTFEDPAARTRLLQAALIASTLWGRRIFDGRLTGDGDTDTARKRALGAFRRALEESAIAPHIGTILGRGWSLFSEHFPPRYPDFAREFFDATGLTVEEYFTCVTGVAVTYLPFDSSSGPTFIVDRMAAATAYREVFSKYLALETQTPEQLAVALWNDFPQAGYRGVRERPILVLQNGRAVILDPVFYCERISVGPLFHLTAKARGDKAKSIAIFSAFGKAFEDYAVGILRRMYPDHPHLASRLRAPLEGRDRVGNNFEMDAVLNDVIQIVVFEMKAAWLRDDVVLDEFESWLEQIRSRYGVAGPTAEGEKERPKGVAQLAKLSRRILDGNLGAAQSDFAEAKLIYPVLLVHDTRLNAPVYGNFLAGEFAQLLGTLPSGKRVIPLIVMTIDDLENLQSSIEGFSLRQLLDDYAAANPDGIRSLHNFMATSPVYMDKLRPSEQLKESSERLMRHAHRELFPASLQKE
jgi:hypothetical protein